MGMVTSAFANTHRIFGKRAMDVKVLYILAMYILKPKCFVSAGAVIIIINLGILSLKRHPLCSGPACIGRF